MRKIQLTQEKYALVDNDVYDELNQYRWYYGGRGYAIRHSPMKNGKRTKIYMHRFILNSPEGMEIDHINGNRIDNRLRNLRICTRMENLHNQKKAKNNTSGYRGLTKTKWGYEVRIGVNNKPTYLGLYKTIKEALAVRNEMELKYYGKFANIQKYRKEIV